MRSSFYNQLLRFGREEVALYRQSGESAIIPANVQKYIDEISKASEVFTRNQDFMRTARYLKTEFGIAMSVAQERVSDAINYFYINNRVRNKAWDYFFALEDLANQKKLALKTGDLKLAFEITKQQHAILTKTEDEQYDEEQLKMKPQLLSPDVSVERLGIAKFNLNELYSEASKKIGSWNIPKEEKERLRREAALNLGFTDAEIIEDE